MVGIEFLGLFINISGSRKKKKKEAEAHKNIVKMVLQKPANNYPKYKVSAFLYEIFKALMLEKKKTIIFESRFLDPQKKTIFSKR